MDINDHVIQRPLDRRHDIANAREVKNIAAIFKNRITRNQAPDIDPIAYQIRIALVMREIAFMSAGQIVEHAHTIAALQQEIHHVAPDETRATRNNRYRFAAHAAFSL